MNKDFRWWLLDSFPIEIDYDYACAEYVLFDRYSFSFILAFDRHAMTDGEDRDRLIKKLTDIYEPKIDKAKWLHEDWSGNLIDGSLA